MTGEGRSGPQTTMCLKTTNAKSVNGFSNARSLVRMTGEGRSGPQTTMCLKQRMQLFESDDR